MTLYGSYDTTDLKVLLEGNGHTQTVDAWYQVDNLPGYYALTSCEVGNGTHRCKHWHVTFDPDNGSLSDAELRSLACHETGHTVGLMHPQIQSHGWSYGDARFGCMRTSGFMDPWDPFLRGHNVRHINNFYG